MSSFFRMRLRGFDAATMLLVSAAWVISSSLAPQALAAGDGEPLVATSVCDAHRLKALQEEDPDLVIEIPAEFDKQFPSATACESHDAAWDVEAPGPMQPIPFSHKHHAGEFGIDCQYCHSGTDMSRTAGVPSVEVCMGCHSQFPKEYDELEGIQILKKHWEEKKPIEWNQVHRLPEHVKFRHNRHIQFGLECQQCHGPVQEMDRVHVQPDTTWKYFVPAQTLEMGWCIQCHRKEEHHATTDCMQCHM
jgi:hypothetical protein